MKLATAGALALALAAAAASGCSASGGGDKAGGPASGPVVLRMASAPSDLSSSLPVADFIRRVQALSGGTVRIKVISQWGDFAPSDEAQVVHAVATGTADLGWASSEAFDTIGVRGMRALSAPMLIDSYPLEAAVLKTTIPARVLAGLSRVHVTGLAVLGDELRHPIAVRRPLRAPADWRGLSIGSYRSGIQGQAIRALGATLVVAFGPYRVHDLATGAIQGFELDLPRYVRVVSAASARYVTTNVVLWPLFDVLFANPSRLASLTPQQRGWLQQAARQAAASSVRLAEGEDRSAISRACALGARLATATPGDLAALRAAFAPVYRSLDRDPQTRAFIGQIQHLKTATPPGPVPAIPARCAARH